MDNVHCELIAGYNGEMWNEKRLSNALEKLEILSDINNVVRFFWVSKISYMQ